MSSRRVLDVSDHAGVEALFVRMYSLGAFPMADPPSVRQRGRPAHADPPVHWYAPDPRATIPLEDGAFRVWDGLRKARNKRRFVFTADACFDRVVDACAAPGPRRGGPGDTWLSPTLARCYKALHARGRAHSLEAWLPPLPEPPLPLPNPALPDSSRGEFVAAPPEGARLVGGIYGVSIGAAFFAESMFSLPDQGGSNASSLCLLHLWTHLRACDYALLDVQIANHHTAQFGLRQLPASDYLALLTPAVARPCAWKSPVAPARSIAPPA